MKRHDMFNTRMVKLALSHLKRHWFIKETHPQYGVGRWRLYCFVFPLLIIGGAVGWLFYMSTSAVLLGMVTGIIGLYGFGSDYKSYCDERALDEFYDITVWLLAGYQSGKTLENSMNHLVEEWMSNKGLKVMYLGSVLYGWPAKLRIGATGMELFDQLGMRTGISMIQGFADLLKCSQKHGGSAIEVIHMFHRYLREERVLSKEVNVLIAQKKLEHQLISCAPLLFLAYLQATAYEFISPLYVTSLGRVLMTGVLFIFVLMWLWGRKLAKC